MASKYRPGTVVRNGEEVYSCVLNEDEPNAETAVDHHERTGHNGFEGPSSRMRCETCGVSVTDLYRRYGEDVL